MKKKKFEKMVKTNLFLAITFASLDKKISKSVI
jgi:hypothetical protein